MKGRILAAFAAIYLIWGSTYLAIRVAIDTMPPFLMAGSRFLVAGALLYGVLRLRGAPRPALGEWKPAALVGGLMLLGGNGLVSWSELLVPSGLAAVLVAVVPMWVVLLQGLGGTRPAVGALAGVGLGLVGVAVLVGPLDLAGGVAPLGAAALMVATLSWAAGTLFAKRSPPASPLLGIAMTMLAGGALLALTGLGLGEGARVDLAAVSAASLGAWVYLVLLGSLAGFTAYVWLVGVVSPTRVATYAFVNPVVAVALGWALAGEPVTPRTLLAGALVLGAVALLTLRPRRVAAALGARLRRLPLSTETL